LDGLGGGNILFVMRNRGLRWRALIPFLILALAMTWPVCPAAACGGGAVALATIAPGVDTQRIFLAYDDQRTEVVTVVTVPRGVDGVGVLIPVPALPSLDPDPVPIDELDRLTADTNPRILIPSSNEGPACGCPTLGGSAAKDGTGSAGGVQIGAAVVIGPVTATILDGKSIGALEAWLDDNQFVIPPDKQALLQNYTGVDRLFVAIRRGSGVSTSDGGSSDASPGGGAVTAVGIHMSLPGDQRLLPLRFARLGAGPEVGFTVFVAATTGVKASPPFETLSIADLDEERLRGGGYSAALLGLAVARDNHAFVAEHRASVKELENTGAIGPHLKALLAPEQILTRLSTRLPSTGLTDDVDFTRPDTSAVPTQRTLHTAGLVAAGPRRDPDSHNGSSGGGTSAILILTSGLLLAALGSRNLGARNLGARPSFQTPTAKPTRPPLL
jgi:hypothetical protein